ncbi:unnamed protein product, partial [Oncorhynchus mykiss]
QIISFSSSSTCLLSYSQTHQSSRTQAVSSPSPEVSSTCLTLQTSLSRHSKVVFLCKLHHLDVHHGLFKLETLHCETELDYSILLGGLPGGSVYHKDSVLVTTEDQIPIVEVDDSYGSSLMQDFLWFTKLSCMWEDVRWLRQSMSVSMSSSSTLQARQKMLSAAGQLQNLLGTHNLGRVHYEPIKDRHGNVLLLTIRDMESQYSFFNGKWMQVSKLQSQRKSLSTPEEPYALDILLITIQVEDRFTITLPQPYHNLTITLL